jgi:hypothetical protein
LSLVRMATLRLREPTGGVPNLSSFFSAQRRVVVLGSSLRVFQSGSVELASLDGGGGGGGAAAAPVVLSATTSWLRLHVVVKDLDFLAPCCKDRKIGRPTC